MNNRFLSLAAARDPEAVPYLLKTANPATAAWQERIDDFIEIQKRKSKEDAELAQAAFEQARTLMLALGLFSLAGSALFALQTSRSIANALASAVTLARQVAAGDLTGSVSVHPADRSETGALLRALNDMNGSLHALVSRTREGACALSHHAAEIAHGNMELSARTEKQAGALEETAASMEQLAATVKNNAETAGAASGVASDTAQQAAHGGEVVARVVEVMGTVESSSQRIVDIIDVINGIAFQTNILALNAAVEAARAGDQGRGFAVVASEVRTLAQRTATASHEIKDLIHGSVDQITACGTLARDAGTAMERVVGSVNQVATLVAEIATATAEQSTGIEQTYQAVAELDQINQQNTAMVEEMAATAASLKDEAATLEQIVSRFELEHTPATTRPARAGASAPPRLGGRRAA
jgi:methyl-accepting chemotaxis protein